MNLPTLLSLQKRIREATGPDRELDCAIANLHGWRQDADYNYTPAGAMTLEEPPTYTTYPEGLGACVGLMIEVLPDAYWSIRRTALRPGMIPGGSPHEFRAEVGDWGTPCKTWHDRPNHALLLAICAALIAQEAKQKETAAP